MAVDQQAYRQIIDELAPHAATLVAVSKTKSVEEIKSLYELGQRDFGENYVQELVEKQAKLPQDIRWHFIGHLQSNKARQIAPFVHLVQSVDSVKLLQEIDKQAKKTGRVIDCLLQVHVAREETKFGFDEPELQGALTELGNLTLLNIRVVGLMGMASFTTDMEIVRSEFRQLRTVFNSTRDIMPPDSQFNILSMGMSSDFHIALEQGSTLVRIGSLLFGARSVQ